MRPMLLALVLALPAAAQDKAAIVIQGVDSGAYAVELKILNAPRGLILWRTDNNPPGLFTRKVAATRSYIVAGPPGTYTATAEVYVIKVPKDSGDADPELVAEVTKTFTLTGGAPGPGPGPIPPGPGPGPGPLPPVPPPPAPVDPLVVSLKAAAAADGMPPAKLAALSVAFAECARLTVTGKTVGELMTAHKGALAGVKLPNRVADALSAELRALDPLLPPSNPSKLPTNAELESVRALMTRLSLACSEAAK
jgi:hypothetical protein